MTGKPGALQSMGSWTWLGDWTTATIPISIKEMIIILKSFKRENSRPENFIDIFYQTFETKILPLLHNGIQNSLFYDTNIAFTSSQTKTYDKKKLQVNILNKYRHKTHNKILANWIWQYRKRIIYLN